jgi:hypothetical protein
MTTKRGRTLRLAILALVAISIAIAIAVALIVVGKGFDLIDYLKKLHGGI